MRKNQIFALLIVCILISIAGFSMPFYVKGDTPNEKASPISKPHDMEGIDGTPRYQNLKLEGVQPDSGNTWTVYVINDATGGVYEQNFECIFTGLYGNIWIGLNPTYDTYVDNGPLGYSPEDVWYFTYPWTSTGYPDLDYPENYYLYPGYQDWIYGWQLQYVLGEFDSNIHDTDVNTFGVYEDRPGPLDDHKTQILVFNIRDDFFYTPLTAGGFIEGYFWSEIARVYDANVFHMDTYQWWRRLGDESMMDYPPEYNDYYWWPPHEHEYEGTFAHEFQHLIHHDIDPDELSWVNEGCSTLAEWICGYGFSPGHISQYLIYFWDTSLVIWEGYLSNYGAVFLWTFYMYEHYGFDKRGKYNGLIWDLVHEQANGIEGWSNVLAAHRIKRSFDQIFQDWAIANYLDDTSFAKGIYGYYALDLPSDDSNWYDLPYVIWMWEYLYPTLFDWQVDIYPHEGYNYPYGSSLPYTVNYVEFYDGCPVLEVDFNGDDFSGVLAISGEYKWHSDGEPYSWFRLGQTFNIPATGATLTYWNYFDIEEDWDFGYVEVHDLTTDEWYTLAGYGTVDNVGFNYGTNNPNCPDEFEPTTYYDAGRWHAFTGSSYGWYQEVMDLSMFAGHEVELYFTYWTDPYTLNPGWYIDDIAIPEIGFFDDCETSGAWTVNAGWYRNNEVIPNDFKVNFIEIMDFYKRNGALWFTINIISQMRLNKNTQEGKELLLMLNTKYISTRAVMVAANQPGFEHGFTTFYSFTAGYPWHCCHKH